MKWQLIVAGARTAVFGMLFLAGTASAELRIMNDPGGEVSSYLRTFYEMRASGQRIIIDGPCLSACTLLTGIVGSVGDANMIARPLLLTTRYGRILVAGSVG